MINLNSLTSAYSFESSEFGNATDKWLVRLLARTNGFWTWILSFFKIKRGMVFEVYSDRVVLNEGWRHVIPVQHISNLGDGYQSQGVFLLLIWISAFVGIYKIWGGKVGAFFVWGLIAALFAYLYVRSRRFVIDVKASSGHSAWFSIKRSYFGGVALPDDDLYRMADIIQGLVVKSSDGRQLMQRADGE